MRLFRAERVDYRRVGDLFWGRYRVEGLETVQPGQFFQVGLERIDLFLPRPLSVAGFGDGMVDLFLRVKGRGTQAIADSPTLRFLGPLGKGFSFSGARQVLLLAGGMGIAPLRFLAQRLRREDKEYRLVWGMRDGRYWQAFGDLVGGCEVLAEDGSVGRRGDVKGFLEDMPDGAWDLVCVCGPSAMNELVLGWVRRKGLRAQFSLEAHMGCGWGGCRGCWVRFAGKELYVCEDGPVVEVRGDA